MLPKLIARILGRGHFPRQVGQGLPDPVAKDNRPSAPVNLDNRNKALGRIVRPKVLKP
jgi:hypothetical protein